MIDPVRILILDDNDSNTKLLQQELKKSDLPHTMLTVGNKKHFINALEEIKPDIILSDQKNTSFNCLEALALVQSNSPLTPFLIIGDSVDQEFADKCKSAGAWDYILKDNLPVIAPTLKEALSKKTDNNNHRDDSIQESLLQLEGVLGSIRQTLVVVYDRNGNYQRAWGDDEFLMERYGINCKGLIGNSLSRYYAPKDAIQRINYIKQVFESGEELRHTELTRLPKGNFWLDITLTPLKNSSGEIIGVTGFLYDISDRIEMEEELNRLATAFEQVAECIVITDTNANIVYVNPVVEKVTGYSREELINRNCSIFNSNKHDKAFFASMWKTILSGNIWNGHIQNRKKDGTIYEEEVTISPIKSSNGIIQNYVAVKRDVTNEVKMEKQLRQAQKMEAIGTLAGGIAHDFNNILAAILGYTELSLRGLSKDSKLYRHLQQVLQAGYRAKDLIKQILAFSRQGQQEVKPLQISLIIKEALKLLRASLPTTIEIRQNLRAHNAHVLADPTQIHQLVMNLCTNAAHAMRNNGGILQVSMYDVEITQQDVNHYHGLRPGSFVKLSFTDNGHGMSPEIIERIFEPYFTTKKPGEGTGMGLSVVHGIVKSHQGDITVYSELGKGTTINILLPRLDKGEEKTEEKATQLPLGSERILFVDDEESLVEIGQEMLEQLGYKVIANINSVQALELFKQHPDDFDLIITDQTMPNLTGADFAKQVLKIRPDIPIVLCTGFSEVISEEKAKDIGIGEFIMKPMFMKEIAYVIRRLLDHDSTGE